MEGTDEPGKLLYRQPECAGARTALPDAEDSDAGIGIPAQSHASRAAADVKEDLA
jgi:hypothetical protein